MVDYDVLIEKVNSIQNCLKRIHDTAGNHPHSLDDLNVQDIVVLNLQIAVQHSIDIAMHIASEEKLGIPQYLKDVFRILKENKYLKPELALKMEKMVGFRNIAVHDYQAINHNILKNIVEHHLTDIEDFYTQILLRYKSTD
jgi:uncharacterized protein YutE (UPF0331/DUF86 family)